MHLLRLNGEKIGKFVVFVGGREALGIDLKCYLRCCGSSSCSYHLIGFGCANQRRQLWIKMVDDLSPQLLLSLIFQNVSSSTRPTFYCTWQNIVYIGRRYTVGIKLLVVPYCASKLTKLRRFVPFRRTP